MRQCPQCNDTYPDEGLKFCGRDGSPLVDLSQAAGGFASLPISPSEIVLLYGDQFAARSGGVVISVPISGAMVDARQLGLMMVTAAVLGCEQAGSIYLQIGSKGGVWGGSCLHISQGPIRNVRWQQWSLEYRLCGIMSQGVTRQLPHVITQLWQTDFKRRIAAAWIHARTLVLQGLAARNLISAPPDFSVVQVAPVLASLPPSETTEPLQQLFSETSAQRSPIWATIQKDIEAGVSQRARADNAIIVT
jgi:hypothetical protein